MIIFPLKPPFKLTQEFGENLLPLYASIGHLGHNGVDAVSLNDRVVHAPHDGYLIRREDPNGYGIYVQITSDPYGPDGKRKFSILAHLSEVIAEDGFVFQGEPVGVQGSTGNSTGPHLHWTFKRKIGAQTLNKDNGYGGGIDPLPLCFVWQPFIFTQLSPRVSTSIHAAFARGLARRIENAKEK